MSAAEAANRGKVVSSPRVVAMNNQSRPSNRAGSQASGVRWCRWGEQRRDGETPSLRFEDAKITPDNRIILDVGVTKDSLAGFTDGNPIINTRRVNTRVIANNGDTVITSVASMKKTSPTPSTKCQCLRSAGGW